MDILAESTSVAIIKSPIEHIDVTGWLFTLSDNEYQACSTAHLAAGNSRSKDGRRMSINVEQIAGNLLIQHYTEETGLRDHCEVRSLSDSLSPMGRSRLGIVWSLKLRSIEAGATELTNYVQVLATAEFGRLLTRNHMSDLEIVKAGMLQHLAMHNAEETPLFALDIERKANTGRWI